MSRPSVAEQWAAVRDRGRAAFIPYLTFGFPTLPDFGRVLVEAQAHGADFVEVGVPFTDPVADGPTIQRSCKVALEGGATVAGALAAIRQSPVSTPVVLFTYLNPVLAYGVQRFVDDATAAGVGAVLFTDLPAGADPGIETTISRSALDLIRLVAPTTSEARLPAILEAATGFVYLVSRLGVTGAREDLPAELAESVARVRPFTDLPLAVGFGVRDGVQAEAVATRADGVVVGSALVSALDRGGVTAFGELMDDIRQGIDRARSSI